MVNPRRQTDENELLRREQRILRYVIEQFVSNGIPVGSRTLSKMTGEHLSPASIRNTLADLEDKGYLFQPHVSAGRVPTDRAYRYYVDHMMEQPSIPLAERHEIEDYFSHYRGMVNSILEITSSVLSRYSHYIGIVTGPRYDSAVFRQIQFLRQSDTRVLVVFVTGSGIVYNKIIEVDWNPSPDLLQKISNWVIDHFSGMALREVKTRIADMLRHEQAQYDILMRQALLLSRASFRDDPGVKSLYIEGTSRIVAEPEFASARQAHDLLRTIEEKTRIIELIEACLDAGGVQVVLGSETELKEIQGCSLVAGAYSFPDGSRGSVAVLGPSRMPYSRTVFLVDYVSQQISRVSG